MELTQTLLAIVGTLGGWEAIKWLLTRKSNILSDIITEYIKNTKNIWNKVKESYLCKRIN